MVNDSSTPAAAEPAVAAAKVTATPPPEQGNKGSINDAVEHILPQTLFRLSAGLPIHELDIIIKEAMACEDALEREIATLENELGVNESDDKKSGGEEKEAAAASKSSPLKEPKMLPIALLPQAYQPGSGDVNYLESVDAMLETEFTPPDRYFTISALVGRLREPLKLPYPPNSRILAAKTLSLPNNKIKKSDIEKKKRLAIEKQQTLLALDKNAMYHMEQPDTTALLNLYKRVSSHRTAAVFRKPVNPLEAPGYKERVLFPMDLSLLRKMIVARMIKSFASFHQRIALICHNCVKFNGRESDYAVLTRDFEDLVDDKVLEAVKSATIAAAQAASTAAAVSTATIAAETVTSSASTPSITAEKAPSTKTVALAPPAPIAPTPATFTPATS